MESSPVHSYDDLVSRARQAAADGRKKTVAVAAAQDVDVIGAVAEANADGFLDAVLIGDQVKIESLAREADVDIGKLEIVDMKDVSQAAHYAARLAAENKADAIMKGFLPTSALLRVVLDKAYGLRGPNTLSHCAVLDIPGYHKLLNFTDGGMVVRPEPDQKLQILENAVLVGRALGLSPVRIALSAAVDKPTSNVAHTLTDIEYVIPRALEKLENIYIQGPMTLEIATSKAAAEHYELTGHVVGDADIFLVDSIEECNIVCKSLINFADAIFAGVIVGARVPVSLVSRTDTVKNKKASLAIACVLADYYQINKVWE